MIRTLEVFGELDELGHPEEFTWDLFPVVESNKTQHLDDNGLPRKGTRIDPGMIVVGKIGKSREFDPSCQPSALEIQGLSRSELSKKYGAMWKDGSLYADPSMTGIVKEAHMEDRDARRCAVVVISSGGHENAT